MKTIRSLILCEGETDQALIGSYMENTDGWKFENTLKESPFPKENVVWYSNEDSILGIWQVGGNNFTTVIETILNRELLDPVIHKIAIITDHDDVEAETHRPEKIFDCLNRVLHITEEDYTKMIGKWYPLSFTSSFANSKLEICYLLVPIDDNGAIETFMLNALSEQSPEKEQVISQAKTFVSSFQSEYYLIHRREKIKAELGVSLSVFNPDRVFTPMKELIDSVEWEKYETSNKQFQLLKNL